MRLPHILTVILLAFPAFAEETGTISVTGIGTVESIPDMVVISVGANAQAESAAQALTESSQIVSDTLATLKDAGIAENDIQTSGLSLTTQMNYNNNSNQPPEIAGYLASNTLTIRVRDIDALGALLDQIVSEGANSLGGIQFTLSDPKAAQDQARQAAIKDGMDKAGLYAEAAGITLGKLISISDQAGGFTPQPLARGMMAMEAVPVPVAPGEVTSSAQVQMVFEITEN